MPLSGLEGSASLDALHALGAVPRLIRLTFVGAGAKSLGPRGLKIADGRMFFSDYDRQHGREPWVSDGTRNGTFLIRDLVPGRVGSLPHYFTPVGRNVVYGTTMASDVTSSYDVGTIWTTTFRGDGSPTTSLLRRGHAVTMLGAIASGDHALLSVRGRHDSGTLLRTDGTRPGTQVVTTGLIRGDLVARLGARVIFTDAGNPLWITDGTSHGTLRLHAWPDSVHGSTFVMQVAEMDGRVYFTVDTVDSVGSELWVTDGTPRGTHLLADVLPGRTSSYPTWLTPDDDLLFFTALDDRGRQLWMTDGTARGTVRLTHRYHGRVRHLAACRGRVYFTSVDRYGEELWASDGSRGEAHRVADILPGRGGSFPWGLTCSSDGLVFSADDGQHGRELWTLAGPGAAPVLHDLLPHGSSRPGMFTRMGSTMFFAASTTHGRELWAWQS